MSFRSDGSQWAGWSGMGGFAKALYTLSASAGGIRHLKHTRPPRRVAVYNGQTRQTYVTYCSSASCFSLTNSPALKVSIEKVVCQLS
jgi:hypothetical protein